MLFLVCFGDLNWFLKRLVDISGKKMNLCFYICLVICLVELVSTGRDFYSILGIKRGSTKKEIKKAYRDLAKKLHPDKNKDDKDADTKFREINEAYEILNDDEKRKIYDRHGEEGLKDMGGGGGGGSNMDPFASFFGFGDFFGGGNQRKPDEIKGEDITMEISVTLEELYNGNFIELVRNKLVKKPIAGNRKCNCRFEMRTTPIGPGRFTMNQVEERTLDVEVEKGIPDGHKFTFRGEGEPHSDGDPGDLNLVFKQRPHGVFHRKNDDLYTNITISLVDALNGFNYELTHLDGRKLKISRSKVTWPGSLMALQKEGMPNYNDNSRTGSLYITFDVALPRSMELSSQQKEQIRSIFSATNPSDQPISLKTDVTPETASETIKGNGPPLAFNGFTFAGPRKHLSKFL
ncbi:DnaJ subfamily B member 11 [Cichlidogyrus casuarinus]|uniref:DnaJ subfamily B member 11 n=1 Tax=Cichlidogyrus casuarinus TaxID=1844966 RepID=A0ABD2Q2L5_9PLAT